MRNNNTEFQRKLETLNDKIHIYRGVAYFTTRCQLSLPSYQKAFYEKKQKALEEKLQKEKEDYEKEMDEMNQRMKKNRLRFGK